MGSLVSSHRASSTPNFSLRFYINRRRRSNRQNVPQRDKRSSMNRPVLRLQVKQETLERQKIKTNGGNIHMVSKGTLRNIARESGICPDHFFPDDSPVHSSPLRSQSLTNSPNHPHHLRRHSVESRDSMVIVQFVDNGDYDIGDNEKHENGYDKLLPPGEFEHLCTCTYGRVSNTKGAATNGRRSVARQRSLSDSQDEHFTTVRIDRNGRPPTLMQALSMGELRDRIVQHMPPQQERDYHPSMQKSYSTTGLSSYQLQNGSSSRLTVPHHRLVQTSSRMFEDGNDWSLGESIIRTLSRGNLFDIENPTHESEREIVKQWPELTTKIRRWRQSQQNLHQLIQGPSTECSES